MGRSNEWFMRVHGEHDDDDGYDAYLTELSEKRFVAEHTIKDEYVKGMKIKELFPVIWKASTEILDGLEVQVVIDGNNDIHVSSGSAGYVDFQIDPVGMKLPIRCWIHTHPFGSAYFSGTDKRTVKTWQLLMEEAYVLGGVEHYGHWVQDRPYELDVYQEGNFLDFTQQWEENGRDII